MAEGEATFCGLRWLGTIGIGAFGSVQLVRNSDNDQFAVKMMPMRDTSPINREVARNEVRVMEQLSHHHVIIYVDSLHLEGHMCLITEVCLGGDLGAFLEQMVRPVPEDLLRVWLWQMACGLEYMHTFGSTPIMHRDLKPSNIYLTETGDIRLGDMGISRILESPDALAETFCGSYSYMSPEVVAGIPYGVQTDIWSLGCCVLRMLTLKSDNALDVLRHVVVEKRLVPEGCCSGDVYRLLCSMLRVECTERPTATAILDSRILHDCEDDDMQPFNLLNNHNLLDKMGLRLQPPGTSSSPSTSSSFPDPHDSPSLATLDRNEGRTLREYHDKRRLRMRGRRKDQTLTESSGNGSTLKSSDDGSTLKSSDNGSTLKSSDNGSTLKSSGGVHPSALYTSYQKTVSKTVKKKLVIEQQDVSLSRRLVSSFASSLTSVQSRRLGDPQTQTRNVCMPPLDPQVMVGASAAGQMAALKSILVSMLGEEMWNEACFLIMTVTSPTDLQAKLASLLGDLNQLSQMVIYCYIAESMRPT